MSTDKPHLRKADAKAFFKTWRAVAAAADVTSAAVAQWGDLVPERSAWRLLAQPGFAAWLSRRRAAAGEGAGQ